MEQERSASRSVIESDLLLKNIMMRLPSRHLLRLSLVDTRWRRLTSGPNFLNRHTRHHCIHSTSERYFIIHTPSQDFNFNPTTKAMTPRRFRIPFTRILQTSHGLMLLECRDSMQGPKYYCVVNPTMRRPRKLSIERHTSEKIVPFFLKFDPSISEYYKVGFMRVNASCYHTLDVYDSGTREWEQRSCPDISFRVPNFLHANTQRRICLQNAVFSVAPHGGILHLDVDSLTFGMIMAPSILYERNHVMEWNNDLYCISIFLRGMLVHKLKTSRPVWKQILRVDLNRVYYFWPEMKGCIAVLGMAGVERDNNISILFNGAGKIVAYRFFDNSFELLFDLRLKGRQPLYLLGAHHFNETFALV